MESPPEASHPPGSPMVVSPELVLSVLDSSFGFPDRDPPTRVPPMAVPSPSDGVVDLTGLSDGSPSVVPNIDLTHLSVDSDSELPMPSESPPLSTLLAAILVFRGSASGPALSGLLEDSGQ